MLIQNFFFFLNVDLCLRKRLFPVTFLYMLQTDPKEKPEHWKRLLLAETYTFQRPSGKKSNNGVQQNAELMPALGKAFPSAHCDVLSRGRASSRDRAGGSAQPGHSAKAAPREPARPAPGETRGPGRERRGGREAPGQRAGPSGTGAAGKRPRGAAGSRERPAVSREGARPGQGRRREGAGRRRSHTHCWPHRDTPSRKWRRPARPPQHVFPVPPLRLLWARVGRSVWDGGGAGFAASS